jgi:cytochrome P450/NADPH-cytochrome P450 reductase
VLGLLVHRYRLLDDTDYHLKLMRTLPVKPTDFQLSLVRRASSDRRAGRHGK